MRGADDTRPRGESKSFQSRMNTIFLFFLMLNQKFQVRDLHTLLPFQKAVRAHILLSFFLPCECPSQIAGVFFFYHTFPPQAICHITYPFHLLLVFSLFLERTEFQNNPYIAYLNCPFDPHRYSFLDLLSFFLGTLTSFFSYFFFFFFCRCCIPLAPFMVVSIHYYIDIVISQYWYPMHMHK